LSTALAGCDGDMILVSLKGRLEYMTALAAWHMPAIVLIP